MKFTLPQLRTLQAVLIAAIENEDSYLDSLSCGWRGLKPIVPKEYQDSARRTRATLKKWKKLQSNIDQEIARRKLSD
jgi:hypothetical protein